MTGITRLIDSLVVSGLFDENQEFCVIFYTRKAVQYLLKYCESKAKNVLL